MTPEQKALLEPYAQAFADLVQRVELMEDDELEAFRDACGAVRHHNCWWATYEVAKALSDVVDGEIRRRRRFSARLTPPPKESR